MDAFIEIIEKLVDNVPGQTWLEQNHFPFKSLKNPQAKLYDICLFETNAQGAYGFLWIEFKNNSNLLIYPFCLSRYKEDGDLISLPPWSLRNASSDNYFYESWRSAQKQKNPLLTAKKASFYHKKMNGEPSFVAMDIWSDTRNTCVRLDFQIAYKIFRTLEQKYPQSAEVELLSYLGTQSVFSNFAKLTSIFEYSSKDFPKAHVAIGMKYIQNNGTLFPRIVSLLHKYRFPKKNKLRESMQSWRELLQLMESLGRMLGDFHKAMSLAPRHSDLAPEPGTGHSKATWLNIVFAKLDERLERVLERQKYFANFSGIFYLLPGYILKLKESILNLDDLGMRIRNHGNIHLGQILIGVHELVLLDYDAGDLYESQFRFLKQPCLDDFTSLIISLRFAWYFTESKYYSLLAGNQDSLDKSFINPIPSKMSSAKNPESSQSSLFALEHVLSKFYKNSLDENLASSELLPKNPNLEKVLFNFFFIMRLLKEILHESPEGNPRPHIWLLILQDFMVTERPLT